MRQACRHSMLCANLTPNPVGIATGGRIRPSRRRRRVGRAGTRDFRRPARGCLWRASKTGKNGCFRRRSGGFVHTGPAAVVLRHGQDDGLGRRGPRRPRGTDEGEFPGDVALPAGPRVAAGELLERRAGLVAPTDPPQERGQEQLPLAVGGRQVEEPAELRFGGEPVALEVGVPRGREQGVRRGGAAGGGGTPRTPTPWRPARSRRWPSRARGAGRRREARSRSRSRTPPRRRRPRTPGPARAPRGCPAARARGARARGA